jgi:NADH:ubiquinone reductase (H+-translocating)
LIVPFYIAGNDRLRIAIVGGGYAGLAALEALCEHRPDAEIVLIDPRSHHLKISHLHETFRRPRTDFEVSFQALEKRFNMRHIQEALEFDESAVRQWNRDRRLEVGNQTVAFDFLLMATGAQSKLIEKGPQILDLSDFMTSGGPELLEKHVASAGSNEPWLTIVGCGATGVQFLFEIAHYLRARDVSCKLRLVDGGAEPLQQFHSKMGRYVKSRLHDLSIEYRPNFRFLAQEPGLLIVEDRETDEVMELPSDLSLLFIGKDPVLRFETNWFGQIATHGETLDRVFAAGDCSRYRGVGSNAMSAQSALRKGRLVARNILSAAGPVKIMEPYLHRELGYVISMGPSDAIGWLGFESNVVAGLPAGLAKELIEAQYDLLLAGIDTYIL